ncbi:hypothetical protein QOT17_004995 [Balamuthia mandrillaris]
MESRTRYPAGVWPCCIGEEDGKGYLLLGRQGGGLHHTKAVKRALGMVNRQWEEQLDGTEGWCVFWGKADPEDASSLHTAAREGSEEGLNVFGSMQFLVEVLRDSSAHYEVFGNCFLICLGVLSASQRDEVVALHKRKRNRTINPTKREMVELRWFEASDVRERALAHRQLCKEERWDTDMVFDGMAAGEFVRRWFACELAQTVDWNEEPLCSLCKWGKHPFPQARDRFGEWLRWEWTPEEKKDKEKEK